LRYIIPAKAKAKHTGMLASVGLVHHTVLEDLDSFARYLIEEQRLTLKDQQ
jgi:hypothetical protein